MRPATAADVELLVAWHADPEVARYWDDETCSAEEVLLRITDPDVDAYIVEANGVPVGYLQAWFDELPPATAGLDMFLVPTARGRGLGPDAARTLVLHLTATGHVRVTADPYRPNAFAIRGWVKAGFHHVSTHDPDSEHSEAWELMAFTPKGVASP